MIEELKPCPFCHEKEHLKYEYLDLRTPGNTLIPVWVACMNCGCHGKVVWIDWIWTDVVKERFEKLAAEAWNTRHELDDFIRTVKTRINELGEQIEENFTYRSRELVNHEIVVLKWVLSLRKPEEK